MMLSEWARVLTAEERARVVAKEVAAERVAILAMVRERIGSLMPTATDGTGFAAGAVWVLNQLATDIIARGKPAEVDSDDPNLVAEGGK